MLRENLVKLKEEYLLINFFTQILNFYKLVLLEIRKKL